jgi:CheY-like chemotaxis protein
VAHDFNKLLMVISSYARMAHDNLGPEDGTIRSHLEQVLKASEKAATLTHQLLAFSRKQVLVLRTIDLNAVVEDTLKMVNRLIGEDIELTVSLANGLWAITADPSQIVQVLMNLCINARDAMPNGGRLTVETHNLSVNAESVRERPALLPADYAVLIVSDTGAGITKEVQAHIFEPFFTTKESGSGTGLGLSMVYGVVKQSEGYIWVKSEPGRGSSFTIYLPAVEAPLTTTAASEVTVAEGQGEIVLLVEDEEALREAISTYLNLHGYTVLEAGSGEQALQIASEHEKLIHVLLTDIILPKMSGTELAQELAKKYPDIVTIYMSGYTDRAVYGVESATVGFLQKPFALEALLQKLREMIATRD